MKSTQIISLGLLGLLMCVPFAASAQDGADAPVPTLTSVEPQEPEPQTLRDRRQMLRENAPVVKPIPARMMASGTRPLPPRLEKALEQRDRTVGSGTPMMDARKERVEERREAQQERRQERRSEILKRMANQMIKRMTAAIERIEKLSDRVDSRIVKLKEKGVDTSAASANIAIARTKIADAKSAVALAEAAIAGAAVNADVVTEGTTPNDAGKPVREALEKARIATVAAHKALVDAIGSLKANVKTEVESRKGTTSPVTN